MSNPPLLDVQGLVTRFHLPEAILHAVSDVSFRVEAGQRFGIVGESGSGKTVTALSILGLVDAPGRVEAGQVCFKGRDLRRLGEEDYRKVRGAQIGMIFQDPLSSLNPVMRVGDQLVETIRTHRRMSKSEARDVAVRLLAEVGLPASHDRLRNYPHELSGGMRQRVAIALALAGDPDLLIADEPTTALDVTLQAQFLDLLSNLTAERGIAVILITHDLAVMANFADEIAVMYAGRIVEQAPCELLFGSPAHPYTRRLLASVSRLDRPRASRLDPIPGVPPSLIELPAGCPFHPRCDVAEDRCRRELPGLHRVDERRVSACHLVSDRA